MAHALFTVVVTFVLLFGTIGSAISSSVNGVMPADLPEFSVNFEVRSDDAAGRVVAYSDGKVVRVRFSDERVTEVVAVSVVYSDKSAISTDVSMLALTDSEIKLPNNLAYASMTVLLAGRNGSVNIEVNRS